MLKDRAAAVYGREGVAAMHRRTTTATAMLLLLKCCLLLVLGPLASHADSIQGYKQNLGKGKTTRRVFIMGPDIEQCNEGR